MNTCAFCGECFVGSHVCPKMVNPPLLIVMGGRFLMDNFQISPNVGRAPQRVERRIFVAPADGSVPSC